MWQGKGCIMCEIFFVNISVFVKPKNLKTLKNMKNLKLKNFLKTLFFPSLGAAPVDSTYKLFQLAHDVYKLHLSGKW